MVRGRPLSSMKSLTPNRALTMHVFSASVTLALEVKGGGHDSPDYTSYISHGKDFLRRVESQNMVAQQALKILDELSNT